MRRLTVVSSTVVAAAIALSGCSASSTAPPEPTTNESPISSPEPAPEPVEPVATAEPAPTSADEWCTTVIDRSGVTDYVLRLRPDLTDTIDARAALSDAGAQVGHVLTCSGYGLTLVAATYANADVAAQRRALTASPGTTVSTSSPRRTQSAVASPSPGTRTCATST